MRTARTSVPAAVCYRDVRLIDCTGASPRAHTDVLVEAGRIVAVGEAARARTDARVSDQRGRTVMPGLVNADDYLSVKGIGGRYYSVYKQSPYFQLLRAARNALRSLAQGITTIRDVGSIDRINMALRDAIDAGLVVGPRIYACGTPIAPTFDSPGVEPVGMTVEAEDAGQALEHARSLIDAGADFLTIKVHRQDFKLERKRWFTADEMRPAIDLAHLHGLTVGSIGQEPIAFWRAIEAGIDTVSSGRFVYQDAELPKALASAKVTMTVNLAGWARAREFMSDELRAGHRTGAQRCLEAGVTIATGTTFYGDDLVDEILALRSIGMDAMTSLQAATLHGAKILRKEDEFGTVEPGKRADLIFVDGDPLSDPDVLRRPRLVVANGVEHDPARLIAAVGPMTDIPPELSPTRVTARG